MRVSDISALEIRRKIQDKDINSPIKGLVWYSKGFLNNASHFFNLMEFWLGEFKSFKAINLISSLDDGEIDVFVNFKNGKVIFLSAGNDFSHHSVELFSSSTNKNIIEVDMCGVNLPGRGDFKISFNADIKPYFITSFGV